MRCFSFLMFEGFLSDMFLIAEFSACQNVKLYTYKELSAATDDFSPVNKIGEGGFGSVYKVTTWLSHYHECTEYYLE